MRRLRRRVCSAIGTLLVILGAAFLLAACAEPPHPSTAPAPAHPRPRDARPAPLPRVAPVPLPLARPAAVPAAPHSAAGPAEASAPRPHVPAKALTYAPLLAAKQRAVWASAPSPWTLAGQIEQESCASLSSLRCWDPHAELKTSREYGFGLGQITVAYRPDGSERFNEFNELKKQYAALSAWRWENRYDPAYQLTAIVAMMQALWGKVPPSAGDEAHWAFALNAYNGGLGGLLQDRRLCVSSGACDPRLWFGNIETHSLKSRAAQPAYGRKSFYQISRDYVRNVLNLRRAKYEPFWRA